MSALLLCDCPDAVPYRDAEGMRRCDMCAGYIDHADGKPIRPPAPPLLDRVHELFCWPLKADDGRTIAKGCGKVLAKRSEFFDGGGLHCPKCRRASWPQISIRSPDNIGGTVAPAPAISQPAPTKVSPPPQPWAPLALEEPADLFGEGQWP